jgi:hypothetical protein
LGDLSQFEIALQAFAAQHLANGSHTGSVWAFEPIIQQGKPGTAIQFQKAELVAVSALHRRGLTEAGGCFALLA